MRSNNHLFATQRGAAQMKSTNIIHTTHNTPPNVSNVREKGGDLVINALNTTFESLIVNCTI